MATILIIDDDTQIRSMVRMILESLSHVTFEAENGKVGVELLRTQKADLMITDLVMEVQGGLETIVQVRREMPDVKIIAISGGSPNAKENLEAAARLGAHRTMSKPFLFQELRSAVDDLLRPSGVAADARMN